ncbi:unnamed protein product [Rotaria sp. Silwood2]|nr:unnamed protein product [Rotaria sp. Silwood2]
MGLDLFVRFDCQPKTDSSKSFIGVYNVALKALKDEPFQLINLHGNNICGNNDHLHVISNIDVHRWSTLYSFGILKRNTNILYKRSIG